MDVKVTWDQETDFVGLAESGFPVKMSSASGPERGVGPVEAVDNWMNTLYHRLGLLDPNLQRIGFGV